LDFGFRISEWKDSMDFQQLIRQPSAHTPKAFRSTAQGCPTFVGLPWVGVRQKIPRTLKGFRFDERYVWD
jgi:hypothetical protein